MTFIYANLTRIPWRYAGCANMNFLRQGFRKLSYDKQTDRETDTTEIIYHATSRVVDNLQLVYSHIVLTLNNWQIVEARGQYLGVLKLVNIKNIKSNFKPKQTVEERGLTTAASIHRRYRPLSWGSGCVIICDKLLDDFCNEKNSETPFTIKTEECINVKKTYFDDEDVVADIIKHNVSVSCQCALYNTL